MEQGKAKVSLLETLVVIIGMFALIGILLAEGALAAPEGPVSAASFASVMITPGDEEFTISGVLYDQSTGEALNLQEVQAYCNGEKKLEAMTDGQGIFSITGKNNACGLGTDVLLKTVYNDNEYSVMVYLPALTFIHRGGSASPDNANLQAKQDAESSANQAASDQPVLNSGRILVNTQPASVVPEFSLPTLALAIIGVGLGLALLRKH